ncbi:MAG: tRNA uridine-5-carboxymethylaminomethyl(34) synthesis enzyme MnmG [Flavobacteriaceae bacterium]|nr:tRNA uridine-5-carboxymethylaminomethyl(34) synthesis enzyme MnmG [Flavobacteriaceae bacterium]|tara:strand:+ start:2466 stop:4337 length:1872 start_codon:yes stop_codon:yes gene_type:complete
MFQNKYDVIVVGAGHAGSEAAAASANMGSSTLLITMNLQNIAQMSCNPAMGGIAKGQIIKEIDALGGYSGLVTDYSAIQFKMLNKSKGPAVWSPRAQSDRMMFSSKWREMLESTPNLDFYQDSVVSMLVENSTVTGVVTQLGIKIYSKSVILTSGTFLNGLIHVGEKQFGGGRVGEKASIGVTEDLVSLGFVSGRMKTGTPPRVDGRSLNYNKMDEHPGDISPGKFSYLPSSPKLTKQRSCYVTYTNLKTHDLLREGFDRSPMFNGRIKSIGPRYCPSVEDKINRFSEKDRHQIFVEPEGWNTVEVYVNGFSTSLPEEVQFKALKSVQGFEDVKFFRPGYAIEYDYFPPTQLKHSLETKPIENLFFAGQINGTTGYEEAAAQGLMAGINAHLKINNKSEFILKRNQAYIGVLIDDLITKGTDEPYRMFTSRAEFRMLLRQDNADIRLSELSYSIGLATKDRYTLVKNKLKKTQELIHFIENLSVSPNEINPILENKNSKTIDQSMKLKKLYSRPNIVFEDVVKINSLKEFIDNNNVNEEVIEQAEIQIKYSGYIQKESANAQKLNNLESIKIPEMFDYNMLKSVSSEAKSKLEDIRPKTLSQASRISGVSPADISAMLVFMGR